MWMMPLDAPASESTARSRWRNLRRRPRPGDFESGHIPGAKNLSVATRLSKETLATVAGKDDEVVFSCFGKHCPYSAYASAKALLWGYTHVDRFAGGFAAWQDGGYPTENWCNAISRACLSCSASARETPLRLFQKFGCPRWVNSAIRGFPGEGPLDLNKQTFWKLTDQFDRAMMS